MKVTFANTKRVMFFNLEGGEVFKNDDDEVFIKGDENLAVNVNTGEITHFSFNELVYPLPNAELIIK